MTPPARDGSGGGGPCYRSRVVDDPEPPRHLPFLESLSWSDQEWRTLAPLEMLRRYEAGWRHLGVTADPSSEEAAFIRALVRRFGSFLDVPT